MLRACRLCPRRCGVNRTAGELGSCGIDATARVCSAGPHFGEEPVLVGRGGSGTIFFAGCNLHCVFCQNFDISQTDQGRPCSPEQIASYAVELAQNGCVNINFVTPTHVAHAVAEAIVITRDRGLSVPTVYNCGGYESVQTLHLLEGLIDVYMPDIKYAHAARGRTYSDVNDYPAVARTALAEMYRQVGPWRCSKSGMAERGVLVRHLVLPEDLAGSRAVVECVADTAPGCGINVMAQYRPAYRTHAFPELRGRPDVGAIRSLRDYAQDRGLVRVDH